MVCATTALFRRYLHNSTFRYSTTNKSTQVAHCCGNSCAGNFLWVEPRAVEIDVRNLVRAVCSGEVAYSCSLSIPKHRTVAPKTFRLFAFVAGPRPGWFLFGKK